MLHSEPEYRRRIRNKAAENKGAAERERQEAAQDARIEKIIGSVEKLVEQVDRYANEKTPENERKRRWEKAEVIGLWAAAFVGVAAICFGSHDSHEQRDAMNGQLAEMRIDEHAFIFFRNPQYRFATTSAGIKIVMFDGEWVNSGKTPAHNLKIWATCNTMSKLGEVPDFSVERKKYPTRTILVGPGSSAKEGISGSMWTAILVAPAVGCFGEAKYDDTAGQHHRTQFCYWTNWINEASPEPFIFVQCERHNCADGDCEND